MIITIEQAASRNFSVCCLGDEISSLDICKAVILTATFSLFFNFPNLWDPMGLNLSRVLSETLLEVFFGIHSLFLLGVYFSEVKRLPGFFKDPILTFLLGFFYFFLPRFR